MYMGTFDFDQMFDILHDPLETESNTCIHYLA